MSNVNIHIYQSDITKESRMFKISDSLEKISDFDQIILAGVQSKGLPLLEERSEKTVIRRAPVFGTSSRTLHYLLYCLWLVYLIITKKPKVLNVHSLELLPYAMLSKFLTHSKVIYDAHELETEKMGMSAKRQKLSLKIEKMFIKYCDEVIVVGEAIANHYKKLYPNMPKPKVVLNVPKRSEVAKHNKFRERFAISNETTICLYQGVINKGRGIEVILNAFKRLDRKDIAVVFLGYGPYVGMVERVSNEEPGVYYHEAVKPDELMPFTSSADIGLCIIENQCLSYYYSLPNKMFEYTMAGLPVVTSDGYEMSRLVNEYGIGYVTNQEYEDSLVETLTNLDQSKLNDKRDNIVNFRNKFNWENQEVILKEIYQEL